MLWVLSTTRNSMIRKLSFRKKALGYSVLSLCAFIALVWLIWKAPEIQVQKIQDSVERARAETYARDVYIKAVGGLAVIATAIASWRNLENTKKGVLVAEEKQVTERFAKAVEMLADSDRYIRLGGIYALERIAKDSDKDYWQVMEILSAFIRSKSARSQPTIGETESDVEPYTTATFKQIENWRIEDLNDKYNEEQRRSEYNDQYWYEDELVGEINPSYKKTMSEDVQAAITAIGRRKIWNEEPDYVINLRNLELTGICISGNYNNVDFSDSHFICTTFRGRSSNRSSFDGTNFSNAYFMRTETTDCSMQNAVFRAATIGFSKFQDSNFTGADFTDSLMDAIEISDCELIGSNFSNVEIGQGMRKSVEKGRGKMVQEPVWLIESNEVIRSDFRSVRLNGSVLSRLSFKDVNFQSADFIKVKTKGMGGSEISTTFEDCCFIQASFKDAELYSLLFKNSNLSHVSLAGATLGDADFEKSNGLTTKQVLEAHISKYYKPKFCETLTQSLRDEGSIEI